MVWWGRKVIGVERVSMKSGLEGRNNGACFMESLAAAHVSMKSGLEGRNNESVSEHHSSFVRSLNEVRPRRPEQFFLFGI